jgi:hypothetical protein
LGLIRRWIVNKCRNRRLWYFNEIFRRAVAWTVFAISRSLIERNFNLRDREWIRTSAGLYCGNSAFLANVS